MTHTFTIAGRLPGANEAIGMASHNRYASGTLKRKETRRCALAAIAEGLPKIMKPVKIHFKWIEPNRKRDIDNVRFGAKYIMDGLQESGKLPNDSWLWVVSMSDEWAVDRVNPRIEVTITEVEGGPR